MLSGMIAENHAFKRWEEGLGRVVFSRVVIADTKVFVAFYIDNSHGPYEVIPLRSIGIKNLKHLGHVQRYLERNGRDGIPEFIEFDELKKMKTTPIS